jgi:alpha-L-rhamnosidase
MIQPMIYNYDAQRFFQKYMFDMRSSAREEKEELYFGESFNVRSMVKKPAGVPTMIVPGKRTSGCATPDWGTAMVQIPWYLYLYYGDRILLEDFYPDMELWVAYVEGMKEDGIIPHGLGDWCPPGGNVNIDCPVSFSSSAFHILDVSIMEQTAGLMGEREDQDKYARLLKQLKTDLNHHFFDTETGNYGTSQTANVMALDMDIVPDGYENKVCMAIIKNIREEFDGFLNTGIFGLARVFKVLSENGYEAEVYRLLAKTGENSFATMWDQFDATTLWETLPTNSESGSTYSGSMSHPMQAGFDSWFYSGIAGINPTTEGPGFQVIEFKPYLTRQLESASARYKSKSGVIESKWVRSQDTFRWEISIPPHSKGVIYIPTYGVESTITVNGSSIDPVGEVDGFSILGEFESGSYQIESKSFL